VIVILHFLRTWHVDGGEVVSLKPNTPRKIPGSHFSYRLNRLQGHSANERIRFFENKYEFLNLLFFWYSKEHNVSVTEFISVLRSKGEMDEGSGHFRMSDDGYAPQTPVPTVPTVTRKRRKPVELINTGLDNY
jgi:hypothetical protein